MIFRMALLNLRKHWKRTLLILFAVMVSVLVMEVVAGMFQGISANFFRNITQEGGHVVVTAEGYSDRLNPYSLDYTIDDYAGVSESLQGMERVQAVEAVLQFGGLLQHDARDIQLAGIGVRPDTRFYRSVRDGVVSGHFPPDSGGIVISRSNARLLQLSTGDSLLLVVQDSTGSPFYREFRVDGVFDTDATEFDDNHFFLKHSEAEELLYLPGATTEVRLRLDSTENVAGFANAARQQLGGAGLEIRTYRDIHSGLLSMIEMMDFFTVFMNLFVVIVAASVITNAILMNVFDRIREFGTMRAIGVKKRGIARMILVEGVLQGLFGSLLGLAVGIPIVLYLSQHGIDFGGISEAFGMGSSQFRFGYSLENSGINLIAGMMIAVAGSLYAAFVGMRLSIMEALRYE